MSILLTIFKVIGIVLLVLLCLLILLACCILFVPIRYQAYAKLDETLYAKVKCSYLLHIVTIFFGYEDGKQIGKFKIFGITIRDFFPTEEKKKQFEEKEKKKQAKRLKKEQARKKKEEIKRKKNASKQKCDIPKNQESSKQKQTVSTNLRKETSNKQQPTTKVSENATQAKTEASKTVSMQSVKQIQNIPQKNQEEPKKQGLIERIKELAKKVIMFYKKIIDKVKNIKYTICNLWDKLLHLKETIRFYYEILTREESKRAISKIKTQLGRLLKHIKPQMVKGIVEFGFEDPATTGDLFGKLCMFYPLYGNNIVIIPHFEENLVKGELTLKGRIRIMTLLHIAWKIIFDKEIRTLYKTLTGGVENE